MTTAPHRTASATRSEIVGALALGAAGVATFPVWPLALILSGVAVVWGVIIRRGQDRTPGTVVLSLGVVGLLLGLFSMLSLATGMVTGSDSNGGTVVTAPIGLPVGELGVALASMALMVAVVGWLIARVHRRRRVGR